METNTEYDVAIIGGGLGGLTLAIQCADAGYCVVLFEKEQYPFHKVCGEYISNESKPFLTRLGIPITEWNLPAINQLLITDIHGHAYPFTLDLGGFGISRFRLDNALYQLALQKNVQVYSGTKVLNAVYTNNHFIVEATNGSFSAKVTVGSFGKRSNFDVQWKRILSPSGNHANETKFIGVKYHIRYPFLSNQIALHNFKNGYCGISMIEEQKCCLCYLTTAENLRRSGNRIEVMEEKILFQNPGLKKIFTEAGFLYASPQVIAQVSFAPKTQVHNHVLMVGDAAGLITPLCGNGMSMAMHAGRLAFNAIDMFLQGKINRIEMEQQYSKSWQHQFKQRLWAGRQVQALMGAQWLTSVALKVLHRFPALAKKVISSTHGQPF
ncbi:MAG: FAD-binding protein [Sphingobacteriales bacterium]|uniref:NAD(P)/FAD-dependent oxidoreductase n=1 Tax=Hydrotalea flava TaxID=714549 RepID=UPI0008301E55|nr:FAD-dependent oxidoreductase [Hydrotalea flava]RTL48576.1 MAG: FAD-binding protein [Sphingobacteriales bacterium]